MFSSRSAARQKTALDLESSIINLGESSETWFDGTLESIDRRIARVDSLRVQAYRISADSDIGDNTMLEHSATLDQTRRELVSFRDNILNTPLPETYHVEASRESLTEENQRFVKVVAKSFTADNRECLHPGLEEIKIRAYNKARDHTSTQPRRQANACINAFVQEVVENSKEMLQARTARRVHSAVAPAPDVPDELLFG